MPGGLYCCAYGCGNNTKNNKDKSFFRMPTDPEKLAVWLSIIKREDLLEKAKSGKLNQRVCCDHFSDDNITYIQTLNKDAIPRSNFDEEEASTSIEIVKNTGIAKEKSTQTVCEPVDVSVSFELPTNTVQSKEKSTQTTIHESVTSSSQTNEEQLIKEESTNKSQCDATVQTPSYLLVAPRKRKSTDIRKAVPKLKLSKKK